MDLIPEYAEELQTLVRHVDALGADGRRLRVLEAGCGRAWHLSLADVNMELVGVDTDAAAIQARSRKQEGLSQFVIADLRDVDFDEGSFDLIYSSFVLEHITGAEEVLTKFSTWLKPGGMIILRIPDRRSVHGFVTRITPFWVHVLYHKYYWGKLNAGKPGFDPYPTVYEEIISRDGIREFARRHNLKLRQESGIGTYRSGPLLFRIFVPMLAWWISAVTFGRVHNDYVNLSYVLEKPANN